MELEDGHLLLKKWRKNIGFLEDQGSSAEKDVII